MKRIIISILIVLVFTLSSCSTTLDTGHNNIVLPDLSGMNKNEIIEIFNNLDHSVEFEYTTEENGLLADTFITYKEFNEGDIVNETVEVIVILYPEFTEDNKYVVLPDLEGLSKDEIIAIFEDLELLVTFITSGVASEETSNGFISYAQDLVPGDMFMKTSVLPINIYPDFYAETNYFYPIEMEYDGPKLSSEFEDIDSLDPRGGYFSVTLKYCIDGDTAAFYYPSEIYDAIENSAKTTRFLNMDTEETHSGGEEE